MAAPVLLAGKPAAAPASPATIRQNYLEAKNAFLRLTNGSFEKYMPAYLELFKKFPNETSNDSDSLFQTLTAELQRVKDLKESLEKYINTNPDNAGLACFRILEVAFFREAHSIPAHVLDLMAEKKIVFSEKSNYNPIVNLLIEYCTHRTKKFGNDSAGDLINKVIKVFSLWKGNFSDCISSGTVSVPILAVFLQGALLIKSGEFLLECVKIIKHSMIKLTAFNDLAKSMLDLCLKTLKEQRIDLVPEILRFLCDLKPTTEVENFCKTLMPVVDGNPALILLWIEQVMILDDVTLTRNLMTLLKKQMVTQSSIVKEKLMNILILSLDTEKVDSFRDELRKGILVLPEKPKESQPETEDSVKPRDKSYHYVILEHFLTNLEKKSEKEPLSEEDKAKVIKLLNYGLKIHEDDQFIIKCIDFIRKFNFARELPLEIDLTKLKGTLSEPFIYEARAKKAQRPLSEPVLDYMLCPSNGLNVDRITRFLPAYISGMGLGVVSFFEVSMEKLTTLNILRDDVGSLVEVFDKTPRNLQRALVKVLIQTYYKDSDSKWPLQEVLVRIKQPYSIKAEDLDLKGINIASMNKLVNCGLQFNQLNLIGCTFDDDPLVYGKIQNLNCRHLSLSTLPTSAIPTSTEKLTLSGNVTSALLNTVNMKIKSLEFIYFHYTGERGGFSPLGEKNELQHTLVELSFRNPVGPMLFNDETARVVERLPLVTSFTFQNCEITSKTVDSIRKRNSLIHFTLITSGEWKDYNDSFETLISKFSEGLKSFTFKNSTTTIDPGFLYTLKGMELTSLGLSGNVTDGMVAVICADHPKLESLELPHNDSITDASIDAISKLTKLRILNIAGTRLTFEGILKLAEALPNLTAITVGCPNPAENRVLAEMLLKYEVTIEAKDPNMPIVLSRGNELIRA